MKAEKISTILIPTDYSPNAKRAASYGISLARKLNAEVILFHAYHAPVIHPDEITILEKLREDEESKMDELLKEVNNDFGDLVKVRGRIEYGPAVDWLQRIVDDEKVDLIAMGTKGQTNAIDALLGSVASHVINDVYCSVLVIPQEVRKFEINEVLFATDFHETKNTNYHHALVHMLKAFDPTIDIVNFRDNVEFDDLPSKEELKLDHIFRDFKHSFHFIEDDDVEHGIFQFVEENHCDLVIILTKHYNLWQRIFHRSISRKLALHSKVPLFIMHEED